MINWPDLNLPPINQLVLMDAQSFEERMTWAKESPCIQVCKLRDGVCTGCNRTIEEIRDWSVMTTEEKLKVKERLSGS